MVPLVSIISPHRTSITIYTLPLTWPHWILPVIQCAFKENMFYTYSTKGKDIQENNILVRETNTGIFFLNSGILTANQMFSGPCFLNEGLLLNYLRQHFTGLNKPNSSSFALWSFSFIGLSA